MGWDICEDSVPEVNRVDAWVLAIINAFLLPGLGTIISYWRSNKEISKDVLIVGALQFATSYIIFGYFWGIYWSYLLIKNSK